MRTRVAAAALGVLIALAGCTAAQPAETSATATATPTRLRPRRPRRLDCDALLPVGRASAALGVPTRDLEGTRDVAVRGSSELIRESAQENGGLLSCSWYQEDGTASITASAAEDAADAFAAAGRSGHPARDGGGGVQLVRRRPVRHRPALRGDLGHDRAGGRAGRRRSRDARLRDGRRRHRDPGRARHRRGADLRRPAERRG